MNKIRIVKIDNAVKLIIIDSRAYKINQFSNWTTKLKL